MTYHRVFKYLPQVIVIMRDVIIGCGNEPSKLVPVCYVHENSLWGEKKVQSVSQKVEFEVSHNPNRFISTHAYLQR